MRTGRVIMLVAGSLLILIGLGLAAGAAVAGILNAKQGDGGFLSFPEEVYEVNSHALTVPELEIGADVRAEDAVATLQIKGESTQADQELFIGVGPREEVTRYLLGVRHSELRSVSFSPFRVSYRELGGTADPAPPAGQDFWAASASGSGEQSLAWNLDQGDWSAVVMNADGSQPVSADLQLGVRSDFLQPLTWILLVSSIVLLVAGLALVVIGASGLRKTPAGSGSGAGEGPGPGQPSGPPQTYGQMQDRYAQEPQLAAAAAARAGRPAGAAAAGVAGSVAGMASAAGAAGAAAGIRDSGLAGPRYPVRLYGGIDPHLSRWLWLVKWFLAIPHYIVLFFLWIAFFVTTVIAGIVILFTGRYPRGLFEFNVGVVRWSWRVTFYATRVLGTDRYPPFTLDSTDYPADFSVDYPRQLSHWLVLVKWWLLVLPQALVVSAFTQSAVVINRVWSPDAWNDMWDGGWPESTQVVSVWQGLSLLSLLVLIAAVILLFRGRYPRHLFDLLMGLNRWSYRVLAYAALMRDEYPPFRLDQGPADPRDEAAAPGHPGTGQPDADGYGIGRQGPKPGPEV